MRFRPSEVRFNADRVEDRVSALAGVAVAAGDVIRAWRTGESFDPHYLSALESALCLLVGAEIPAPGPAEGGEG